MAEPAHKRVAPVSFTRREHEVLYLLWEGLSPQQVADKLCISKRTVDFHELNVDKKTKADNRVKALRAWHDQTGGKIPEDS